MPDDLYVFKEYYDKYSIRRYEYLGFISRNIIGHERNRMMNDYSNGHKNCYILFLKMVVGFQK